MKQTLLIRTDASPLIGIGHVMRCLALAQAWQDGGGWVVFICAEIPDSLAERIRSEGFVLVYIDVEKGGGEDVCQTLQAARESESKWIVTDGYHFDLKYQRAIRATGLKLLLIDDYNHRPEYEADILLNQNIGAEKIGYRCNPECRKLLGVQYVMLRREFRASDLSCCESGFGGFKKKRVAGESQKKERNLPNIVKNVLVTMGGSDPDNVTLKVIEVLKKLDVPGLHVKVIVGPANPHLEALQQAASSSDISCELISSVRDMPSLMQRADLAISAAGSTCWEFCCLGVPLMTIILAENQVGLSGRLEKSGASKNMGWHYQIDSRECLEDIRSFLDNEVLQKNLSAHARKLVDGGGNFRIIETINGG